MGAAAGHGGAGVAVALHVAVVIRRERELLPDLRVPMHVVAVALAMLLVLMFSPFSTNPFITFSFEGRWCLPLIGEPLWSLSGPPARPTASARALSDPRGCSAVCG
jgi:hypothetical protein